MNYSQNSLDFNLISANLSRVDSNSDNFQEYSGNIVVIHYEAGQKDVSLIALQ